MKPLLRILICRENDMSSVIMDELERLTKEIRDAQRNIENQEILLDVLERDGHDVSEQEMVLSIDRARLTVQQKQQALLMTRTRSEFLSQDNLLKEVSRSEDLTRSILENRSP